MQKNQSGAQPHHCTPTSYQAINYRPNKRALQVKGHLSGTYSTAPARGSVLHPLDLEKGPTLLLHQLQAKLLCELPNYETVTSTEDSALCSNIRFTRRELLIYSLNSSSGDKTLTYLCNLLPAGALLPRAGLWSSYRALRPSVLTLMTKKESSPEDHSSVAQLLPLSGCYT